MDELEKQYDDPIAHFNVEIKQMNKEGEEDRASISINIKKGIRIDSKETNRKNLGYAALSRIYHELGIHTFLKHRERHTKSGYDANIIMKLLVFGRFLYPSSKKKAFENKHLSLKNTNFSLDDMYCALTFFINIRTTTNYGDMNG